MELKYENLVNDKEGETGSGWRPQPHSYYENYIYQFTDPDKDLGAVPDAAIGYNITLKNGSVWIYRGVRGPDEPLWEQVSGWTK